VEVALGRLSGGEKPRLPGSGLSELAVVQEFDVADEDLAVAEMHGVEHA